MGDLSIEKSVSNCTFVKTVLMFMVIVGHSVNFWNGTWFNIITPIYESAFLKVLSLFINSFHIYAFTLTSGYLFAFLTLKKGKYSSFSELLKKKTLRLVIPYIFVCTVWVMPIANYFFHYSTKEMIWKYILGTSPNQLWFLLMLYWNFVIAKWLSGLKKRNIFFDFAVCILVYGIGTICSHILPNIFCIWTACKYFCFFWIGYEMFLYNYVFLINYCWLWALGFVLFFILDFFVFTGVMNSITTIILHFAGAIMAWTILQRLANHIRYEDSILFKVFSKCSMPMYLFHQQIIYFTIVWLNGKVNPWINAGANFILAVLGSLLISTLFIRWKVSRFLIGEK